MRKYEKIILKWRYSYVRIAKKGPLSIFPILGFLIFPLFGERQAAAEYYKYQDKGGNWVFTDSPPANAENVEIIGNKDGKSSGFRDIEKDLTGKYRPKDEIEKACLSAVTIKTPIGQGSIGRIGRIRWVGPIAQGIPTSPPARCALSASEREPDTPLRRGRDARFPRVP